MIPYWDDLWHFEKVHISTVGYRPRNELRPPPFESEVMCDEYSSPEWDDLRDLGFLGEAV